MLQTHIEDCNTLSSAELRRKYSKEWNSHRAMLGRRSKGFTVAPDFIEFRDFLRLLGPRPHPGYTVDRLDNLDPEYAPGKSGWRSKTEQSRNRSNVKKVTDTDGTARTIPEWADLRGISRHTLYGRKKKGWSDLEILYGAKTNSDCPDPMAGLPWPHDRLQDWERAYRRHCMSRNESLTREQFMLSASRAKLDELHERQNETISPYWVDEGRVLDDEQYRLLADIEHWRGNLENAKKLCAEKNTLRNNPAFRSRFINRKSGLGPAQEAAIFDIILD